LLEESKKFSHQHSPQAKEKRQQILSERAAIGGNDAEHAKLISQQQHQHYQSMTQLQQQQHVQHLQEADQRRQQILSERAAIGGNDVGRAKQISQQQHQHYQSMTQLQQQQHVQHLQEADQRRQKLLEDKAKHAKEVGEGGAIHKS